MSVSFPASHLSAYEIGKRIQVITTDGAKIADTLTKIVAVQDGDKPSLFLSFENVTSIDGLYSERGFQVALDQYVKRIEK